MRKGLVKYDIDLGAFIGRSHFQDYLVEYGRMNHKPADENPAFGAIINAHKIRGVCMTFTPGERIEYGAHTIHVSGKVVFPMCKY
jgi:hypothetical protein